MFKLFVILLFPSISFAFPELVSKNCMTCHSQASGLGLITIDGKNYALNTAHKKNETYFEISTPAWLMLGGKADINQIFTKTPYEETGSFKASRIEAQLGLNQSIDTYLNISAQGSISRFDSKAKNDSISDYIYYPYRFVQLTYSDSLEKNLVIKSGFYRNEWQNDLTSFETSYQQTEFIYAHNKHQMSLGYINQTRTYNSTDDIRDGFINYKFFQADHYSILLGHQWGDQYQLYSLGLTAKKSETLTFKAFISESIESGLKGIKARFSPIYQVSPYIKIYGYAEYKNTNIKTAQPRTISYGLGGDYFWFTQAIVSAVYLKIDDSKEINNPTEKLELNLHLYM